MSRCCYASPEIVLKNAKLFLEISSCLCGFAVSVSACGRNVCFLAHGHASKLGLSSTESQWSDRLSSGPVSGWSGAESQHRFDPCSLHFFSLSSLSQGQKLFTPLRIPSSLQECGCVAELAFNITCNFPRCVLNIMAVCLAQ